MAKREREKYQLNFDREKIFWVKNGQKINVYDEIQANNIDTDIYEVMEKYHGDEKAALEAMKSNLNGMYGEFEEMSKLDSELSHKKAIEMWNNLPLKVREKFHNNPNEFIDNGDKWLDEEIKKIKAEQEQIKNQGQNNDQSVNDQGVNEQGATNA